MAVSDQVACHSVACCHIYSILCQTASNQSHGQRWTLLYVCLSVCHTVSLWSNALSCVCVCVCVCVSWRQMTSCWSLTHITLSHCSCCGSTTTISTWPLRRCWSCCLDSLPSRHCVCRLVVSSTATVCAVPRRWLTRGHYALGTSPTTYSSRLVTHTCLLANHHHRTLHLQAQ